MEKLTTRTEKKVPPVSFDVTEDILAPLNIEGKLNSMHYRKGWKRRFEVRQMGSMIDVTLVNASYRGLLAVYLIDQRKLIAVSGIFILHWKIIQRAFRQEYGGDINVVGFV